ncbi:MAG: hypothetical protein QG650_218 [Patescibacteria group bacterium]|nr:hypothetical protein [Patescibacteria group bacterium]
MNVPKPNPGIAELRATKEAAKTGLRDEYGFPKASAAIALVSVTDPVKRDFLLEGLSAVGVAAVAVTTDEIPELRNVVAVTKTTANELYAFDFFVSDGESEDLDIVKCMKAGVTPILPEKNVFSGILKDFNPMKFEGNAFLFKDDNQFRMFAATVSYLENVKFPEDRRILLKHVAETF